MSISIQNSAYVSSVHSMLSYGMSHTDTTIGKIFRAIAKNLAIFSLRFSSFDTLNQIYQYGNRSVRVSGEDDVASSLRKIFHRVIFSKQETWFDEVKKFSSSGEIAANTKFKDLPLEARKYLAAKYDFPIDDISEDEIFPVDLLIAVSKKNTIEIQRLLQENHREGKSQIYEIAILAACKESDNQAVIQALLPRLTNNLESDSAAFLLQVSALALMCGYEESFVNNIKAQVPTAHQAAFPRIQDEARRHDEENAEQNKAGEARLARLKAKPSVLSAPQKKSIISPTRAKKNPRIKALLQKDTVREALYQKYLQELTSKNPGQVTPQHRRVLKCIQKIDPVSLKPLLKELLKTQPKVTISTLLKGFEFAKELSVEINGKDILCILAYMKAAAAQVLGKLKDAVRTMDLVDEILEMHKSEDYQNINIFANYSPNELKIAFQVAKALKNTVLAGFITSYFEKKYKEKS